MLDYLFTTERLRATCGYRDNQPVNPEQVLLEHYPVAIVGLHGLTVRALSAWLERHRAILPFDLTRCRDRALRGGVVACYGCGLLFIDQDDPESERRFTIAHEGAHFLQDHYYPRLEIITRLGPEIQSVLDGLRPPTIAERLQALLANSNLYQHTHLLDREQVSSTVYEREAEADAFACELLAPRSAIIDRFPNPTYDDATLSRISTVLITEFHLPPPQALAYTRRLIARQDQSNPLLHRLKIV